MSLHTWSKPTIECGDGLDHGVDASMPASRALMDRGYEAIDTFLVCQLGGVTYVRKVVLHSLSEYWCVCLGP